MCDTDVVVLPAGMQLVVQSHYINTGEEPLVTHDVMTLFATDADLDSLTRLYLFVAGANKFEIPPKSEHSESAGCVLDKDITMLSLTPHMHEWGIKIQLEVDDDIVANEPSWKPDMRDLPPTLSFTGDDGQFERGQSMRLTCAWRNYDSSPLEFPEEMCAMVGYFTTKAKTPRTSCA